MMAVNHRMRTAVYGVLIALAAALGVVLVVFSNSKAGSISLDQYEIGEYETDPLESAATERDYERARPWRDPGHISREEIRFTRALRAMDTVPRDATWDIPRLWAKYHQAMRDPTLVEPGWTSTRTLTPGADPLQRAVERHGYGAEGHREPEQSWSIDDNVDSDINDSLDRNDERFAEIDRQQDEQSRTLATARQAMISGEFEPYNKPAPRKVGPMLSGGDEAVSALIREMKDIHDDIHSISGSMRSRGGLNQQLQESEAEVKALEKTDKDLEQDDEAQKQRIAQMEGDIQDLRKRRGAARPTPSRMSSLEAAKDLSDYFDQLGAQTAADEAKHVKAELAQLQAMRGGGAAAPAAAAPCPAGSYCPTASSAGKSHLKAAGRSQSLAALVKGLLSQNQQPILPTA